MSDSTAPSLNTATGFDAFWRIALTLGALVLVLVLAWLLLRWMNRRVPGMGGAPGAGRLIRVLDRLPVNRDCQLMLVKVRDRVVLLAVSAHHTEKLCEFDDADGTFAPAVAAESPTFSAALKDAARKFGLGPKDGLSPKDGPGPGDGGELP